jgi:6-phosphogluconolactonase (cycloisomerase 2 family)
MTRLSVAALAAAAALAATGGSASAFGTGPFPGPSAGVVFVQSDNLAGNTIVAYNRAYNGTLTEAGVYPTGGRGGALEGSEVDHLASQGSLAYDGGSGLLYAVNADSNTISVFAVFGDRLALRQVLSSGGSFPVSIAVDHGLVYVLDAAAGGSLQGYVEAFGRLFPIPGSGRTVGPSPTEGPQFTHTPGQVAFSPNGSELIVTTKANGSDIDVFHVGWLGRLSSSPVVNSEPGTVPFGVTFDQQGDLLVAEAGTDALASFALGQSGTVSPLDAVATAQAATCWVAPAGGYFYASNADSASLSGFQAGAGGELTFLGNTETAGGTVDASASSDGRYLYVQTGAEGIVDEYALGAQGALSEIGSIAVPGGAGGEGIVAR